jgi:hypothetical protein
MEEAPSYFREKAKQCRGLAATIANQDARPRPRRDLAHHRMTSDDGLNAGRGIVRGLAIAAVLWGLIAAAVWYLL